MGNPVYGWKQTQDRLDDRIDRDIRRQRQKTQMLAPCGRFIRPAAITSKPTQPGNRAD